MNNYVAYVELIDNYNFGIIFDSDATIQSRYTKAAKIFPICIEVGLLYGGGRNNVVGSDTVDKLKKVLLEDLPEYGTDETILYVTCTLLAQCNTISYRGSYEEILSKVVHIVEKVKCSAERFGSSTDVRYAYDMLINECYMAIESRHTSWFNNGTREINVKFLEFEAAINDDTLTLDDINFELKRATEQYEISSTEECQELIQEY